MRVVRQINPDTNDDFSGTGWIRTQFLKIDVRAKPHRGHSFCGRNEEPAHGLDRPDLAVQAGARADS